MTIQQTSLEAWDRLQKTLGDRQSEVLVALKQLKRANNREIAEYLDIPINQITGRIFELRELKLVEEAGTKIDNITKRKTIVWKLC